MNLIVCLIDLLALVLFTKLGRVPIYREKNVAHSQTSLLANRAISIIHSMRNYVLLQHSAQRKYRLLISFNASRPKIQIDSIPLLISSVKLGS